MSSTDYDRPPSDLVTYQGRLYQIIAGAPYDDERFNFYAGYDSIIFKWGNMFYAAVPKEPDNAIPLTDDQVIRKIQS